MGTADLSRQALFGGDVTKGTEYVLVDDFVGQGGTLAVILNQRVVRLLLPWR